jgi:sporulation protein YlmC with PRC-barrel domain
MTTQNMTEAETHEWHGRTIVDSDGETIGKVEEIYLDDRTANAEWATVSSGLLGGKSQFVPLAGASSDGDKIRASVTVRQVTDAPSVQHGRHLSEHEESALFAHYGIPYANDDSTITQGQSHDGQVPAHGRLHKYGAAQNEHDIVGSVRADRRTSAA